MELIQCDKSKIVEYRKFKDINVESFRNDLSHSGIMDVSEFVSLDQAVALMENTLSNLINKHCPIISRNKYIGPSWFDEELRKLRTKRRAAERRKKKKPTGENLKCCKDICSQFNNLVFQKKRSFYQQLLQSSKGDKKSSFQEDQEAYGK